MNKLLNFLYVIFLILVFNTNYSFAGTKGPADVYKVTMEKIEFCTDYSTTDFDDIATAETACQNAVTIGTGAMEVDIASVDSGATAAAYGNTKLLPLGTTFTHLRVTINRKFTIRSEGAIDTGQSDDTDNCKTITTTDAHYPNSIAAEKYTHRIVVAESGTRAEMELYSANGGKKGDASNNYKSCDDATCSSESDSNWQYAGASDLVSAIAMETMTSSSGDTVSLIYKFVNPITVGLTTPKVDLAFGTREAIGVNEINSLCQFYPEEPQVTITVK